MEQASGRVSCKQATFHSIPLVPYNKVSVPGTSRCIHRSGFFTPLPTPKQAAFDFGDGSDGNATEASDSQADGSDGSNGSATKGGSIASGVNRLKNAGTAISAYEPEPIAASGAVGLACGFGWVDPNFQVGGPVVLQ